MANQTMQGKICMVTGATAGIGEVTAQALAQQGTTVIVVGRNTTRCADTVSRIREASGNTNVAYLVADLSVQQDIHRLSEEFQSSYLRLDVLVNNVGGIFTSRRETADGLEMTFALNHLAPFLLTNLLLDRLKASQAARVVNVSALAHEWGKLDFDDLQRKKSYKYQGWSAYAQAKLANIMFTYEMARRLAGTKVSINALHPGIIATNFGAEIGGELLGKLVRPIFNRLALTPQQGTQTSLYLATSPEVQGVSGKYFSKQKAVSSSKASYDEAATRRLWQLTEELVGLGVAAK